MLALTLAATQQAFAAPDPGATFQSVWARYDRPVADQRAGRSWTWGPAPISDLLHEDFTPTPQPPLPGVQILTSYDGGHTFMLRGQI